ncbi:MAG TPA: FkbM family methyltransferase [Pyrinomonadaceae bacterium]|nr:FkbM family methyltransferase [Pyrinomonadaceae bacterium]
MSANSALRRIVKKGLHPILAGHGYHYFQALSKAWDIRNGNWTEPELDLIRFALKPGETALDLGANFGLYSYHLSKALKGSGRIYAFEPVPFTFETMRLVARLLRLRNVEIIPKGCSDVAGTIAFEVPVQTSGAFAAGQAYIGNRRDDRDGKEQQVRWAGTQQVACEVVKLDDFFPEIKDLTLIKCDIEGAELMAFRGAEQMIGKHLPTVICEINPWFLEGFGIKLSELVGFFIDRGYHLYHYRREQGQGMLCPVKIEEVVEDNYVFIHPQRLSRFASLLSGNTEPVASGPIE